MDRELEVLSQVVGAALKDRGLVLATAESCTGGWIAQVVTSAAGSSDWFERGFVTYSDAAKQDLLGVRAGTLRTCGAVSEETAGEMVLGALGHSDAHVALAVTGVAGPGGGSVDKPVGMVCFAWCQRGDPVRVSTARFQGDREAVRRQAVIHALEGVLRMLARPG